jgi:hypothetical protein
VLAGPGRPALEAAQALQGVLRPADGLSELAIAGHIDPCIGLTPDHFRDGTSKTFGVSLLVVRLAVLLWPDKLQQLGRPDEAADVSGANSVGGWVR